MGTLTPEQREAWLDAAAKQATAEIMEYYAPTDSHHLANKVAAAEMETQKREQFEEEVWCAHKWLDDRGIPRSDVGGEVFSLVGRMMRLTQTDRT
jgi:hypothetical protein